jgi:sugar phosphate isomerase/epimerase
VKISTRESGIPTSDVPYTPEWAIEQVRALGLDGIEFSTLPPGQPRARRRGIWAEALDGQQREQLRHAAAEAGIAITSLSSDWVWGFAEYHPTLDSWERGAEILKKDMDLTADLGARACLIHFARAQATWEQAKRYCAATAEVAAKRGVVAAFEGSLWHLCGLGGLDELLKMVDEIDSPGFAVYAHPRGPARTDADEILQVGKRLACLHHSFIDPDTDYPAMFEALKSVGYDDAWVFECSAEELPRSKKALDDLLARYW